MISSKYFTLKEARISNNCPECYSNDSLELTFKQKLIQTSFYKAISDTIISELRCLNCEEQVFPIDWTDDIEQVVEYHKRAINKREKFIKLKPISWGIITFISVMIIATVLFVLGII